MGFGTGGAKPREHPVGAEFGTELLPGPGPGSVTA
jgi:hypothetical protein